MPAQLLALDIGPSILLDKPILLLGRHPECDIQIDSRKISRRHCCIAQVSDYFVVRDLGSTNGIRINGIRVVEGRLSTGDELTIGNSRYKVAWDALPIQAAPLGPAGTGVPPVGAMFSAQANNSRTVSGGRHRGRITGILRRTRAARRASTRRPPGRAFHSSVVAPGSVGGILPPSGRARTDAQQRFVSQKLAPLLGIGPSSARMSRHAHPALSTLRYWTLNSSSSSSQTSRTRIPTLSARRSQSRKLNL